MPSFNWPGLSRQRKVVPCTSTGQIFIVTFPETGLSQSSIWHNLSKFNHSHGTRPRLVFATYRQARLPSKKITTVQPHLNRRNIYLMQLCHQVVSDEALEKRKDKGQRCLVVVFFSSLHCVALWSHGFMSHLVKAVSENLVYFHDILTDLKTSW